MNLGQALGILHLRIHDLEEGRPVQPGDDTDVVRQLQAEIAALRTNETRALLKVAEERKLRVLAENKLTSAFERIGKLEARSAVNEDLRRKVDEANSLCGALEREVAALRSRPPEVIEKPVPAECLVCRSIKLMVLGVEPKPASLPELPPVVPRPTVSNQTSAGAVRGIARAIRETLATADRPMYSGDIAEICGIATIKINTNISHLVQRGELLRFGEKANGVPGGGYRYWLAARPLPAGSAA